MAYMKRAKSEQDLKLMRLAEVKKAYLEIGDIYNKLVDGEFLKCPKCGEVMRAENAFYLDKTYATNRFPICKKCLLKMVEQREKDKDEPNETKESVQKVLRMMNKVYDNSFYEECIKGAYDNTTERRITSPFSTYITTIQSLPKWKNKTWKDSSFGDSEVSFDETETRIIQKTVKNGKKIFGNGYSDEDYMYLMGQYDDFKARTQVDSKSQEVYVSQICLSLLDIDKDRKSNKDVTKKLNALDSLMNAANLQPRQNISNAQTDALTFGQLIEKWEEEEPIPEPAEEFKDVDGIGKYIRVWFTGWLSKCLGLKNGYTQECEEYIKEYRVTKPEYAEEGHSDEIYERLFGSDGD